MGCRCWTSWRAAPTGPRVVAGRDRQVHDPADRLVHVLPAAHDQRAADRRQCGCLSGRSPGPSRRPEPLMTLNLPPRPSAAWSACGSGPVNWPFTDTSSLRLVTRLAAETTAGISWPPRSWGSVASTSVTWQARAILGDLRLVRCRQGHEDRVRRNADQERVGGAPFESATCSSAITVPICPLAVYPRPASTPGPAGPCRRSCP